VTGGFRVYAQDIDGYTAGTPEGQFVIPYKIVEDETDAHYGEYYQAVSIVTPDQTVYDLLGLTYEDLVRSIGGKSATDI